MTENNEEKPEVKLVQSKEMTPLYTIEICEPVKEQLDKITFCGPNIVVKPCNPINEVKCIPDMAKLALDRGCGPGIRGCGPSIHTILESMGPMTCMPHPCEEPKPEYKIGPEGCIPRIWLISELVYRPEGCIPRIWLMQEMLKCIPRIR